MAGSAPDRPAADGEASNKDARTHVRLFRHRKPDAEGKVILVRDDECRVSVGLEGPLLVLEYKPGLRLRVYDAPRLCLRT